MKNELSSYKLTLNVPTETKIEDEIDEILQNKIKSPTLPPPYNPLPLLTTTERYIWSNTRAFYWREIKC